MDLRGKHILVTGAARGLGRELAAILEKEGCPLILVDREPISQGNAKTYACDLSDLSQRKKLIEELRMEKVDVLVNCAGIGSHSQLDQLTVEEIERVMQVNALAPLELIAGLSPLELVVNIGSVAGEMSLPSMSLYGASKSSVHAFTRSIQLEGVRTLLVILGPLRGTDFAQSIAHPRTGQPNWYRQLDLPVETAASLIVQAMQGGRNQLVAPWWYRVVFVLARWLSPFIGKFAKLKPYFKTGGKRL
ncbi:MAG: SDR family NAD(P)-dependent oxidoreductase [Chloroflexi bacterium]|nr:SDR family NAD(P)-dependent oxidoreductase [Chloroflexota bacterium]